MLVISHSHLIELSHQVFGSQCSLFVSRSMAPQLRMRDLQRRTPPPPRVPQRSIRQYLRDTNTAEQTGNASSEQSKKRPLTDEGASFKQSAKKKKSKASGLKSGDTTDVLESETFNLELYNNAFKRQKDRTAVSRRLKKEQNEGALDTRPRPRGRPPVYAEVRRLPPTVLILLLILVYSIALISPKPWIISGPDRVATKPTTAT